MKSIILSSLFCLLGVFSLAAQRGFPTTGGDELILNIPSAVFSPAQQADHFITAAGQGGAYFEGAQALTVMTAPIHLPVGTTITGITFYTYDNSSNWDMTIELKKEQMNGFASATVVSHQTTGRSSAINVRQQRLNVAVEDNQGYFIRAFANFWDGMDLRVKGVRITYRLP